MAKNIGDPSVTNNGTPADSTLLYMLTAGNVDENMTIAQAQALFGGGTSSADRTIIFQPGGTASGNIYVNWSDIFTQASSTEGMLRVTVDLSQHTSDTFTVPVGAYAVDGIIWEGKLNLTTFQLPTLDFPEGATLTGTVLYIAGSGAVLFTCSATTHDIFVSAGLVYVICDFESNEVEPFNTTTTRSFLSNAAGTQLFIIGKNFVLNGSSGLRPIRAISGGVVSIAPLSGECEVDKTAFQGNGSVSIEPSSANARIVTSTTNGDFTGGITVYDNRLRSNEAFSPENSVTVGEQNRDIWSTVRSMLSTNPIISNVAGGTNYTFENGECAIISSGSQIYCPATGVGRQGFRALLVTPNIVNVGGNGNNINGGTSVNIDATSGPVDLFVVYDSNTSEYKAFSSPALAVSSEFDYLDVADNIADPGNAPAGYSRIFVRQSDGRAFFRPSSAASDKLLDVQPVVVGGSSFDTLEPTDTAWPTLIDTDDVGIGLNVESRRASATNPSPVTTMNISSENGYRNQRVFGASSGTTTDGKNDFQSTFIKPVATGLYHAVIKATGYQTGGTAGAVGDSWYGEWDIVVRDAVNFMKGSATPDATYTHGTHVFSGSLNFDFTNGIRFDGSGENNKTILWNVQVELIESAEAIV